MTYFIKLFREKLKMKNISIEVFSVCIRIQLRLQNEFGLITYVYQVVQAVPLRTLTPTVAKKISQKMRGHGTQCFSVLMNDLVPGKSKKSKSREPFAIRLLNSTANPAQFG